MTRPLDPTRFCLVLLTLLDDDSGAGKMRFRRLDQEVCTRITTSSAALLLPLSCTPLTGKAPPNLPPGVPPLLPNPYIVAPGLLHAYPVGPRPAAAPVLAAVWPSSRRDFLTLWCVSLSLRCTATTTCRCSRRGSRW